MEAIRNNLRENPSEALNHHLAALRSKYPEAPEPELERHAVQHTLYGAGKDITRNNYHGVLVNGTGRVLRGLFFDPELQPRLFVAQVFHGAWIPFRIEKAFLAEVDEANQIVCLKEYQISTLRNLYNKEAVDSAMKKVMKEEYKGCIWPFAFLLIFLGCMWWFFWRE